MLACLCNKLASLVGHMLLRDFGRYWILISVDVTVALVWSQFAVKNLWTSRDYIYDVFL
jgi:hypothetical protein